MVVAMNKTPKAVNVRGGSRDKKRGAYCTPKPLAIAVGHRDLDPFSNPHSHILADAACMLERGDDGFGDGTPGSYSIAGVGTFKATEETTVWFQPDYRFVQRAFDHYQHTRWTCLLRFDPRTDWMKRIIRQSELVCVLWEIEFEPPPGVAAGGGNSFPHALYYRRADDVTDDVLKRCISWRTKRHGT